MANEMRSKDVDRQRKRRKTTGWQSMDPDILENIFKRLIPHKLVSVISYVCRAWKIAVILCLFGSSTKFDLRQMDLLFEREERRRYFDMFCIALNQEQLPQSRTTMIFPSFIIPRNVSLFNIAKRSPWLKRLHLPSSPKLFLESFIQALDYWRDLEEFEGLLHPSITKQFLIELGSKCKKLVRLTIQGRITSEIALVMVTSFPLLRYLDLSFSTISNDALSIIMNGHENLLELNVSHGMCVDDKDIYESIRQYNIGQDYNIRGCEAMKRGVLKDFKVDILNSYLRKKKFIACAGRTCRRCGPTYSKHSSVLIEDNVASRLFVRDQHLELFSSCNLGEF